MKPPWNILHILALWLVDLPGVYILSGKTYHTLVPKILGKCTFLVDCGIFLGLAVIQCKTKLFLLSENKTIFLYLIFYI